MLPLQVHFLYEDMIVEAIQKSVEEKLLGSNVSRTYYTQALLPGATVPASLDDTSCSTQSSTNGE